MILHGWEGCSHSTYCLITTRTLLAAGYHVVRLNLRDHGPQLHLDKYRLNIGIFMATLIEEVVAATEQVAALSGDLPFFILGPSMGGNFALRLAIAHRRAKFHHLQKVIAVSPVLDPAASTRALDAHPFFQKYFRDNWLRSIRAKQARFPQHYTLVFDPSASVYELTETLLPQVSRFRTADEYFAGYAVAHDAFKNLNVATTIITAANDDVIPVEDFHLINPHPLLQVNIHPSGGHVGFVDIFPLTHFLPILVLSELAAGA